MTVTDTTAKSQTDSISFEFELNHRPEKVWRALTDPTLLEFERESVTAAADPTVYRVNLSQ